MAKLISDDKESPTTVELTGGGFKSATGGTAQENERWQLIRLEMKTDRVTIASSSEEAFTLCRVPMDEPAKLVEQLEQLLSSERQLVSFEPQEPSFELNFERSHHEGIKVEAWIDSGNAQTGFYRWDAAGVRFFTTVGLVRQFVEELRRDFA